MHLLTTEEIAEADRLAMAAGTPGTALMEHAGRAVAAGAVALNRGGEIIVLCGPGNNGGDGFVAARHLAAAGRKVRVSLLGEREALTGDAAVMAGRWGGPVEPLTPEAVEGGAVVVDALFGAGLARPIGGTAAEVVAAANSLAVPIVAVDVPSGVDGTTGSISGPAIRARRTITFFRMKPGHLLMPGRELCGEIRVADIGIPDSVIEMIRPQCFANDPDLWAASYPSPAMAGHKYARGHAVVVSGGPSNTGAARLAAGAALRIGAGLLTLASPARSLGVNAAHLTAVMLCEADGADGLRAALRDRRRNAVLLGPAAGVGTGTAEMVRVALGSERPVVLDADAITSFSEAPQTLFDHVRSDENRPVVLTPHEGEFARLFGAAADASKLERARAAAKRSGCTVVLKGPDTVIATPDGRAAINGNAPPWLATAGSGDVLGGMILGLLAQGMPAFEAAAAAVWMHGVAARMAGPGLTADDLDTALRVVIARGVSWQGTHAKPEPLSAGLGREDET
jgi:ADP-dependent NAD(P)H-hydrate dehydratase / NAD(P)H-hydrate epimerase